jgi:hypothetical protein
VVDYPLGYIRGGDVRDFRYRLDAWKGAAHFSLAADLLARGGIGVDSPFEGLYLGAPSTPREKEIRLRLLMRKRLLRGLAILGGLGWRTVRNLENVSGAKADHLSATAGISWAIQP